MMAKMKRMGRRALALFLTLMMMTSLLQITAFAKGDSNMKEYIRVNINGAHYQTDSGTAGDDKWLTWGTFDIHHLYVDDGVLYYSAGQQKDKTMALSAPSGYEIKGAEVESQLNSMSETYDNLVINITVSELTGSGGEIIPIDPTKPLTTPTKVTLSASKALSGDAYSAGKAGFSFELLDSNGDVLQTKESTDTGAVTFDAITYGLAGTYNYTIKEVIPDIKEEGMTYDTHGVGVTVTITAKVLSDSTTLSSDIKYSGSTTFTNDYNDPNIPDSLNLTVSKSTTGDTTTPLRCYLHSAEADRRCLGRSGLYHLW